MLQFSKPSFFNSLRFKLPAPVIISYLLLTISIFVITYLNTTDELNETIENNFQVFEKMFGDQVKAKEEDVIMAMNIMMNNDTLISKFAQGDRDGVNDLLFNLYDNSLKKKHEIEQLQFHTPPATSFLRLHKPSKFGDDLSSFRQTVVEANKNKKLISGIEVGRGGPGLRVVMPVENKGSHIGTVEFGLGLGNILTGINTALNIEYAIGIKKEAFEKAKRFDAAETDIINGDVIFYDYSKNMIKNNLTTEVLDKSIKRFDVNEKEFASYSFPIFDYANNSVGYIVLYSDISEHIDTMKASLLQTILIIVAISILASFILTMLLRFTVIKPLEFMSNAADEFSKGNKKTSFEVNKNDELGSLSNSLKEMAQKINTQLQYLDNLPTPVTIIDRDFNVQYINNAAAEFAGVKSSEVVGKNCSNLYNTPHCGTDQCGCLKAMDLERAVTSETISSTNSQKRPIMYTGAPIKDEHGKVIGALESSAEITDIKDKENYLARSTQQILTAMEKLSNGDLTVSVRPEIENDDIGKLFRGFNNTVENIKSLVNNLSDAIAATASASTQISSSAEELAAGSQEQSAQTGEVASAVEEMAITVAETTKNVTIAADSAKDAGLTAEQGGTVIKNTIVGIEKISDVVTEAASAVELLGASSEKIGEIINVIDDIAGQTNLLALNAAIEAARAGEHGRGFAVVADEVSKLAERTINATKEITETIENIQVETNKAVESIRRGREEAVKGKDFASEASNSLEQIISKTDAVIEQINQVASASEQQATTAEQVSRNIDTINSVTQESSMGIQQIAGAAEDLNKLTEKLQEMVNMFKTNSETINEYSYQIKQKELIS
ncbi:MAG: PAS domain-containing protein [Ignavibacteriales bacterium]|nr:PAS domain-containing protein [Ignavibacteriales bacterium]MCB9259088.1 PAS domain-containing protein [Ignavibacteriales bacterium]